METPLSTGVRELDRELGGGIPPATLLLLRTPPGSQGELLLKELALAHEALYLTTTRTEEAVREWLADDAEPVGVDIQYVREAETAARSRSSVGEVIAARTEWAGEAANDASPGEASLAPATRAIASFHDRGCIVVDPVNPLEDCEEAAYLDFLHRLRNRLLNTGSVGLLHAGRADEPPACRWLSLQFADAVWDTRINRDGLRVEFRLAVTKSRAGNVPGEEVKLDLSDRVAIDVSRDIA